MLRASERDGETEGVRERERENQRQRLKMIERPREKK